MKCPSCKHELKMTQAGDITIESCQDGCGGVWFDRDEILKFDEPHEFSSHNVLELAEAKKENKVDHKERKHCPKCESEPLVRQFFDVQNEVEIDQCWSCGGIWFDLGELNAVRAQYETYDERAKAVNLYVDSQLMEIKDSLEAEGKMDMLEYNEKYKSPLHAAINGFKELLGI